MKAAPRNRLVRTTVTELELQYILLLAGRAGRPPAGWVYDVLRRHLLSEVRRLQAEKKTH